MTQQDTQPPAETLAEAMRRVQFEADFQRGYGSDRVSIRRDDADTILAALTRRAGGDAIPAGMKPWSGGDAAPADWDGGPVLRRHGGLSMPDGDFAWVSNGGGLGNIIAYTPTDAADARSAFGAGFVAGVRIFNVHGDFSKEGEGAWSAYAPSTGHGARAVEESEAERIGLAVADLVEQHLTSPAMVWGLPELPDSWMTELRSILVASLESELSTPKPPAGGDAGAVERAYRQGQIDMRDRAAAVCDERGAEEQESYGLNRAAQNYFRARNAVRDLELAALALPAPVVEGDAADARRYRYLRDHCSYHQAMTWQQPAEWSIGWEFQQVTPDQAFGSFDRWIDEDIERQLLADAEDTEDADAPAALSEGRSHG